MKDKIRVLLTDDHSVVRSGVARLLEQKEEFTVVAEAENGERAYEMFNEVSPDVLVMDMSMPGVGGLEALSRILSRHQDAKVVIFSMYDNATFASQALTSGAMAYVEKAADSCELIQAIKSAAVGKKYLSTLMMQKVAIQGVYGDDNPLHRLTTREFEVFRLLAEGKLVADIAEMLIIGQKTVANYQTLLKQKLGIASSVDLVRLAMKYEIIEMKEWLVLRQNKEWFGLES